MRLSTCVLPVHRWTDGGREVWRRAEQLGFHTAYTYDHLSWRPPFRDGPWFGAVPTLAAAAGVTSRVRLGTLVSSPNFRDPVTLAKELISLDDLSEGRITLGIGAGSSGADATVLGREAWSPAERADRYAEFVELLDTLLTQDVTSHSGRYYAARDARNMPGCVQRPRLPFAVAATGSRGMRLAARYGQAWVTTGDRRVLEDPAATAEQSRTALARQVERLATACAEEGRGADEGPRRILLAGFTPDQVLDSVAAFVDFAGAHGRLGFDEIVLHWPLPDSRFAADQAVFERIATEGLAQL
ncbi:LLM class flavin-dependent oxidoreductase [Streptomyces oceani]|uniref:Luciferase n=1 Tax=Streptomyces oceani TaxID=1075402 RepID=A0A1E7JWS3_9ACTN|nr:LLM class flavin-dependent oxidoreductase [Streptomyces oceani]OEU96056.1 luciferase [Streptomyces oceani]